jgi:hypothetical protein
MKPRDAALLSDYMWFWDSQHYGCNLRSPKMWCYFCLWFVILFEELPTTICSVVQKEQVVSFSIQINHQPDATIFQFIYSSTCFGHSPACHQELNDCSSSLWFYLRIVVIAVLCSWSGRPARPRTQHGYHHNTKVKPEAGTAVTELVKMGRWTPKTCLEL